MGCCPRRQKGCRFDSRSGDMPRFQVQSLVEVPMGDNWWVFLSHISVSLPLSPPPFPCVWNQLQKTLKEWFHLKVVSSFKRSNTLYIATTRVLTVFPVLYFTSRDYSVTTNLRFLSLTFPPHPQAPSPLAAICSLCLWVCFCSACSFILFFRSSCWYMYIFIAILLFRWVRDLSGWSLSKFHNF